MRGPEGGKKAEAGGRDQGAVGGGGRYNGLIEELGGQPTPAVGFGTGIERITLALEGTTTPERALDCYIAIPDQELRVTLLPPVHSLRAAGLRCETDLRGRSLKAMMRHASSLGVATCVIIGSREYDAGVAAVRDMTTGDQREVPLDQLLESLQ